MTDCRAKFEGLENARKQPRAQTQRKFTKSRPADLGAQRSGRLLSAHSVEKQRVANAESGALN